MKRKLSKFVIGMSSFGIGLITFPILTSCSSINDLQRVGRGDGTLFASFGDNIQITFNDEIVDALTNTSSYNAFKQQYANQLLYNFYKKIVDSEDLQSFKDDWSKWNNDIDDDYDDKVKDSKEKYGSKWQFYFQNEVLDPAGGTKEAWKYNQLCNKIRDDFKSKVFSNEYLAYSNISEYNVNNDIVSTFDKQIFFENPAEWRKINFYAKNKTGGNYNTEHDLDDVYALIQKLAFEMYTGTKHPISVSMCLWKYQTPETSRGLLDIYSDKINKESDSTNNSSYVKDDEDDGDDDKTTLKANYEFPAFCEYDGDPSANGKFWYTINNLLLNDSNYSLTPTGFSNIPNDKWYTDDSATQIIVPTKELSSLDTMFGGAAVNLWASYSDNQFVHDNILKYDIKNLLTNPDTGKETDILRNFFFRSNDKRLFNDNGSLTNLGTDLANCNNKIDLNAIYESQGNAGKLIDRYGGSDNFHSKIFRSQSPLFFDYYGDNTQEGGVQWVVSALRLYDNGVPLPYVLIRDELAEGGVHIIGLNGAVHFNNGEQPGYLQEEASVNNDNTLPFSQGRENILLKAQYLWEKENSTSTINLNSKIKSFFENDDNMNDIVISMAKNKTTRENKGKPIIFLDDELLRDVDRETFYELFSLGNNFFAEQSTISAIDSQNKRLFDTKFSNVKNSIISRSESLSKIGKLNYSNGMSTPYPFAFIEPSENDNSYISSLASYDVISIMAWTQCNLYDYQMQSDVWNKNDITFDEVRNLKREYVALVTDLTRNVKPYIQTKKPGKYSEHIYNEWNKNSALSTCVYAALQDFGLNETFSNNVKIKAMQNYVKSCFENQNIVSDFNSFNGYATINDESIKKAFISQYVTNKLLSTDAPLSMYKSINSISSIDEYASELDKSFINNLNRSFNDINYSSNMYDYLLVLDAMQYLVKDNYANLIDYLKNYVIRYGEEGNIVWLSKENTSCDPTFCDDQNTLANEIATYFSFKNNYYGQYSNTYFNNGGGNDRPNFYAENKAYYKFAPIPDGTKWTNAMGYVGLINSDDTTLPITSTISDQIFKNTYYTKRTGTGENDRKGGWYKYGDFETLKNKINICSGVKDITDLVDDLSEGLSEPDFARCIKSVISRSFYEDSDPEVIKGIAKIGEPISLSVLKARLIGEETYYKEVGWGLTKYEEEHETIVRNMFLPFGNSSSVAEICDGKNIQNIDHTIKVSDDEEHVEARVLVLQLNNNDVSLYENLYSALGHNKELIDMLVVQYAMVSSIKELALQDVIKENFDGKKISVYDRRFNDNLGRAWVKDWKSTN